MASVKRAVNEVLRKLTGHQLVTAATMEAAKAETKRTKAADKGSSVPQKQFQALVDRLDSQLSSIEQITKPKPKPPAKMPKDFDPAMEEIWPRVKERTMTNAQKTNTLVELVRYINRCDIPGGIVECGVWRGGSMLAVVEMLLRLGATERDLYLFDTYSGMAAASERDVHIHNGLHADKLLDERVGAARIWEAASLEDVRSGFQTLAYPADKLHFIVGKVEDTIPNHAPEQIALLRLDTDWYESTVHELAHLYKRLAPGGVLIIDDYGSWQGSKDATDEFLDATGEPLMLVRVDRGRVAIKPGLSSRVQAYADARVAD